MVLYRFDLRPDESGTPRKVFAPLTWCKHSANDSLAWRWQDLSEPRPLLRLDELAKRPLVPVVLCEGERPRFGVDHVWCVPGALQTTH